MYASNLKSGFSEYYKPKFIKKKGIFYNIDSEDGDTITLTKDELEYIIQQLDNVQKYSWKEGLFSRSKTIAGDSVWGY